MAGSPDVSDRQLERLIIRAVAALVAMVLSGGVLAAIQVRSARRDTSAATNTIDAPVIARVGILSIGPPPGADVHSYVAARTAVLAAADDDRAGVVSFAAYITSAEARRRTAGLAVIGFLVARPSQAPAAVAADPGGQRVFGAVVRGPAVALRALARMQGVRLVDPGPSDQVPKLANVTGLRPEETTRTGGVSGGALPGRGCRGRGRPCRRA